MMIFLDGKLLLKHSGVDQFTSLLAICMDHSFS